MKRNKTEILLDDIGIPLNMNGYYYIVEAISIMKKGYYDNITDLYKRVARIYKSTPANVERCIRNIQNVYQKQLKRYFNVKYKISNGRLLALILRKVGISFIG